MFPQMLDSVSHTCPDCSIELELLENMNPHFNRRVYGCQNCDSVFDFRATTGCMDPGGTIKREHETLTQYKAKIADQPQAEIRMREARLNSVLDLAKKARDEAGTIYGQIESQHLKDLRAIQEECSPHPNTGGNPKRCTDCGYFFDMSA